MQDNITAHGKSICTAFIIHQAPSANHRRIAQILPNCKGDTFCRFRAMRKAGESAPGAGTRIFRPQTPRDFSLWYDWPRLPKWNAVGSCKLRH
jgi:hypothetical protein